MSKLRFLGFLAGVLSFVGNARAASAQTPSIPVTNILTAGGVMQSGNLSLNAEFCSQSMLTLLNTSMRINRSGTWTSLNVGAPMPGTLAGCDFYGTPGVPALLRGRTSWRVP